MTDLCYVVSLFVVSLRFNKLHVVGNLFSAPEGISETVPNLES